ncbi:MAG TPA: hypothetical protein VHO25_12620 [Polyangiaceae bacterium]|nr:hypothetical protein [Polyangiaceae bacterium]
MKRSNFPGRKLRRRFVAGTITREEYTTALGSLSIGRNGKSPAQRDAHLSDVGAAKKAA